MNAGLDSILFHTIYELFTLRFSGEQNRHDMCGDFTSMLLEEAEKSPKIVLSFLRQ